MGDVGVKLMLGIGDHRLRRPEGAHSAMMRSARGDGSNRQPPSSLHAGVVIGNCTPMSP